MSEEWTAPMIADRFKDAIRSLRRLREPRLKPMQYFSTWPPVVYTTWELMQQQAGPLRLGPPSPRAIQDMEDTFNWIFWVESQMERELIWFRANRIPWKTICVELGLSRSHATQIWKRGLQRIADNLNQGERP